MKTAKTLILCACFTMILAPIAAVAASGYPEKPIRLIIPYKPGGGSDVIMRLTSTYLEKHLGTKIVVKNVSGAGGSIGWTEASRAKPDGYTITQLTNAMLVKTAIGASKVSVSDFEPVANVGYVALSVSAKGDGPYKSMGDYKAAALSKPGNVGLAMGVGTPAQFVAAQVERATKTDLKLVNAGGGAQKKAAVLGGHVDALIEPVAGVAALHDSGELRILAVLSPKRLAFLPNVPTAMEQGVDLVFRLFYGFGVPKGVPQDRKDILAKAVAKLGNDKEYQAALRKIRFDWGYLPGDALADLIKKEVELTESLAKSLGFQK